MNDLLEELNDTNTTYNLKPMDVSLAAVYFIIAVVGIIANMVVFFIIIAGKETGQFEKPLQNMLFKFKIS